MHGGLAERLVTEMEEALLPAGRHRAGRRRCRLLLFRLRLLNCYRIAHAREPP
jgi:hypothetical protein